MKTLFVFVVILCFIGSVWSDVRHGILNKRQQQARRAHSHSTATKQSLQQKANTQVNIQLSLQLQKANTMLKDMNQDQMLELWGHIWDQSPVSDKVSIVSQLFGGHPPSYLTSQELKKCTYNISPLKKSTKTKSFLELYTSVPSPSRTSFLELTLTESLTQKSCQHLFRFFMPEKNNRNNNKINSAPVPEDPVLQENNLPPGPSEDESDNNEEHVTVKTPPPVDTHHEKHEDAQHEDHETKLEQHEDQLRNEGDNLKEIDGTPLITPIGRENSEEDNELSTSAAIEVMFNGRATYFDNCGACTEPAICHDGTGIGANAAICVQYCNADTDCLYRYQPKLHRSFPGLCLTHLGFCHGFEFAADKAGAIASTQAIHADWAKVTQPAANNGNQDSNKQQDSTPETST